MPSTPTLRLSRSLGMVAALGVLTAHAVAFGWAVSAAGHVLAAGWFLSQDDYQQQAARLAGGKVSRSVEIVVTMPSASPPAPVIEVIREDLAQSTEASSRQPAPEDTLPLIEEMAVARARESRPIAPRRSVAPAPQERFAHAPAVERPSERSRAANMPQPAEAATPMHVPRSQPVERPPVAVAVVSLPSTLGTEVDDAAKPIYNPPPVYPAAAIRARIEGRVMLRLSITANGDVESVTLAESSGSRLLDQAAQQAVERWRFQPAMQGGLPVAWSCQLPVRFRLD